MSSFYSIAAANKLLPNAGFALQQGMSLCAVDGLNVLNMHRGLGDNGYPLPEPKGVARSDSGFLPRVSPNWLIELATTAIGDEPTHDIISSLTNEFRQDLSRPYAGEPECRRMHERHKHRH